MQKTLNANQKMKHTEILVIGNGRVGLNARQLLALMSGFGLYFHKNRSGEERERSNLHANELNVLNDVISSYFSRNVKQSRDKLSMMLLSRILALNE